MSSSSRKLASGKKEGNPRQGDGVLKLLEDGAVTLTTAPVSTKVTCL